MTHPGNFTWQKNKVTVLTGSSSIEFWWGEKQELPEKTNQYQYVDKYFYLFFLEVNYISKHSKVFFVRKKLTERPFQNQ